MYIEKTDSYLKSALMDLCGFSASQAERIIDSDKESSIDLIINITNIADQINRLKTRF